MVRFRLEGVMGLENMRKDADHAAAIKQITRRLVKSEPSFQKSTLVIEHLSLRPRIHRLSPYRGVRLKKVGVLGMTRNCLQW